LAGAFLTISLEFGVLGGGSQGKLLSLTRHSKIIDYRTIDVELGI
jgi:hypothetical protein